MRGLFKTDQDYFVDKLLCYLDKTLTNDCQEFLWGDDFEPIRTIMNSTKEEAVLLLADFLKNQWYDLHEDCSWYDSHKSKSNLYCGYWSFDAAAIAKIMELDDSKLRLEQYYPYALMHMQLT